MRFRNLEKREKERGEKRTVLDLGIDVLSVLHELGLDSSRVGPIFRMRFGDL